MKCKSNLTRWSSAVIGDHNTLILMTQDNLAFCLTSSHKHGLPIIFYSYTSGLLEPNTYECPIRTIRTYWLKFSFLTKKWVAQPNTYEWLWLSKSYKYWSSSLWKFISSLRTTRPMAISSKDNSTHGKVRPRTNSTHGNFVQGQLDPRQFRPRDNSTHGYFVQGQLDQWQFRPYSIVAVSTRISWRSSTPS